MPDLVGSTPTTFHSLSLLYLSLSLSLSFTPLASSHVSCTMACVPSKPVKTDKSGKKEKTPNQVVVKRAESKPKVIEHRPGIFETVHTKYNDEIHEKIVDSIRQGRSIRDSGLLAGLGIDTLETWLYNGRHTPDKYPHFKKLSDDIEVAKAERRAQAVDNIVTVGNSGQPGTWQANAWYLERTDPENWGRKDKVEHSGEAPRQQINQVILIDAGAREASRDLLRRVAGDARPDITVGPSGSGELETGEDS